MPRGSAGRRWGLMAWSLLLFVAAVAVAIYAGLYNIAADVPHTQPVYWLLTRYGNVRSQRARKALLFQTT